MPREEALHLQPAPHCMESARWQQPGTLCLYLQKTLRLTAPPLLAFMDSQLRAGDPNAQQRVTDFYRFIDAEEAENKVHFSIKPGAPYPAHASHKNPCMA